MPFSADLVRLYSRIVAVADTAHERPGLVIAIAAPLLLLALAAINRWVLLGFPNSSDEYNYLYEAQTFAARRLWNPAPSPPELFATSYIVQEPARAFSSFPFGWPLLLAMAMTAGVPAWLVHPVLGVLTLGLVWALGTRLYGGRAGVLAAAVIGMTPFFLFNAASYFSHPLCGVLLLGAAVAAAGDDRRAPWVPLVVGLLIGWAVVTRYLTGVICGVPIVLFLLRPGVPRVRTLALVAAGGLPWVIALAAYDRALTGDFLTLTTTPLTESLWFRDGWPLRSADILFTHLLRHLLWTPAIVLPAYGFYLRSAPREMRRGALDWMLVVMVAVLYFYVERGGNEYGPRFHYEVFLFAVLFVFASVFRADRLDAAPLHNRWMFAILVVSVLMMPVAFVVHAWIEHAVIVERMDPFTRTRDAGLRDALVLIADRVGSRRSMAPADLTRNGIDAAGPVLYGLDQGDGHPCEWAARVPDRRPYLYVWDHARHIGTLAQLSCHTAAGASPQ